MTRKKRSRKQRSPKPASPPEMPDPMYMERAMQQIHHLLETQDFESIDEVNAFLAEMIEGGGLPEFEPETPAEKAQELIYEAREASGVRRRRTLARQALEIYPDCADAYVILAECTRNPKQAREFYEQGVAAGERALGPAAFTEDVGHFWGIFETRPYMRAKEGLAAVLWHLGEKRQATTHYQDMLRLNPNDNQGVRYRLVGWLIAEGDDAAAERLLRQYPDDIYAGWAYNRALLAFRQEGAGTRATEALKEALAANPYVALIMLGLEPLPSSLPDYIGVGDENEAVDYLATSMDAWTATPGSNEWFFDAMMEIVGLDADDMPMLELI